MPLCSYFFHRRDAENATDVRAETSAEDRFSWFIEADTGHVLSVTMWKLVREFFARYLKDATGE